MKSFPALFTFFLCLFLANLSAQKKTPPSFEGYHKNITFELGGPTVGIGAAFDMRLNPGRMDGIGFKAGIGGLSFSGTVSEQDGSTSTGRVGLVTFPLEFNHVLGKRRSSFVSGIGILPVYASGSLRSNTNNDLRMATVEGFGVAGGFLNLGYRHQPLGNGVSFHVNWNPMFLRGAGFVPGWVGVGIGVGFK